jgi:superfamily II RNA helicase
VPLYPLFLFPDGELSPLSTSRGLFPKVQHFLEGEGQARPRGPISHSPPFGRILTALDHADLLPAIFFLKSRADCDNALTHAASARVGVDPVIRERLTALVDDYLERYPFLASQPHLAHLRTLHVAAHHAGHLPH